MIVEGRFYRKRYFTSILPKPNFPYIISFPNFILLKSFILKVIYTTNLHYVYLGLIFFGIRLIAYSTVSNFFVGGT
jgi:hypothetical protein